jgi:hypothetical protein
MPLPVADMLKKLGSGVRPAGRVERGGGRGGSLTDFAAMVDAAQRGTLASGRPVEIDRALDVELSAREQRLLELAADAAEAGGAASLVVVFAESALRVDVRERRATDSAADAPAGMIRGVDAVYVAPTRDADEANDALASASDRVESMFDEDGTRRAKRLPTPGAGAVANASLALLLAGAEGRESGAAAQDARRPGSAEARRRSGSPDRAA